VPFQISSQNPNEEIRNALAREFPNVTLSGELINFRGCPAQALLGRGFWLCWIGSDGTERGANWFWRLLSGRTRHL